MPWLRRVSKAAPPPRRGNTFTLPKQTLRPLQVQQDDFNAPLYTLKAFAIATAIVMSTATMSVAGVMAYLDVHNTAEFAARMRTWISQSMPRLTAKIYQRPRDSVPVLADTPTTFDHDAAHQRLTEAFDEGGLEAWAEAAAREIEAETEVERVRNRTV